MPYVLLPGMTLRSVEIGEMTRFLLQATEREPLRLAFGDETASPLHCEDCQLGQCWLPSGHRQTFMAVPCLSHVRFSHHACLPRVERIFPWHSAYTSSSLPSCSGITRNNSNQIIHPDKSVIISSRRVVSHILSYVQKYWALFSSCSGNLVPISVSFLAGLLHAFLGMEG